MRQGWRQTMASNGGFRQSAVSCTNISFACRKWSLSASDRKSNLSEAGLDAGKGLFRFCWCMHSPRQKGLAVCSRLNKATFGA